MDGTLVPTGAECKAGVDMAYNGTWGYHPLVVSLANTGEVLSVLNRPGNRPSHEGAAAEVDRPLACQKTYRMIVVRKNLTVDQGEQRLFNDYRYFFYLTNDEKKSPAEIVFGANDRCNQENLHAQLKGGVRALQAPVDTLESNW